MKITCFDDLLKLGPPKTNLLKYNIICVAKSNIPSRQLSDIYLSKVFFERHVYKQKLKVRYVTDDNRVHITSSTGSSFYLLSNMLDFNSDMVFSNHPLTKIFV